MRLLFESFRFQFGLARRDEDLLLVLLYPLTIAVVLQLVLDATERPDLGAFAIVGPVLVAVWQMALFVAGEIIHRERWAQTLEPLVASPARTGTVLLGRVAAIVTYSLLGFLEAVLVAWFFGREVTIHHPGVFVVAALLTGAAAAATSLVLATLFVASRSARTFQNSLSYPFFVLGGAVVPITLLPDWVQPLSRLVFLSWAGDLLRGSLSPGPVPALVASVAWLVLLGIAGFVVGDLLLRRALRRARVEGTLALS